VLEQRGSAVGATTNTAGYAIGATVITLASAGTGAITAGSPITFVGDTNVYRVTSGDADVSGGGTITLAAPGLLQAIPASATAIVCSLFAPISAANAATTISAVDRLPDEPGAFNYLGSPLLTQGGAFKVIGYWANNTAVIGHGAIEFWLDSSDSMGRFEVMIRGTTAVAQNGFRVAVQQKDGSWGYLTAGATFATGAADNNTYRGLVILGAAGKYKIRLECNTAAAFAGIGVPAADTIKATPKKRKKFLLVTDSYGNSLSESGAGLISADSFVNKLRWLTRSARGVNVQSFDTAASGVNLTKRKHLIDHKAAIPRILTRFT
jgi:hypothetical protein